MFFPIMLNTNVMRLDFSIIIIAKFVYAWCFIQGLFLTHVFPEQALDPPRP